jgi:hypothetical protein
LDCLVEIFSRALMVAPNRSRLPISPRCLLDIKNIELRPNVCDTRSMKSFSVATKLAVVLVTFCIGTVLAAGIRYLTFRTDTEEVSDTIAPETFDFASRLDDFPIPTPSPENTSLADKPPQYLCEHLHQLKEMAWANEGYSGDAIYDALKRKGPDAMPCLIERITDTRPAENPTGAPFWAGLTYRVGDTAVIMLMRINDMYWPEGMLSKKYESMFKEEGMFSYYFYVHDVPHARKGVQRWWRNWLKTCRPQCAIIPSLSKR